MNYTSFVATWHHALDRAGLFVPPARPEETIDVGTMARRYHVLLGLGASQPVEPFTASLELSWRWDALHSARTDTSEEDFLTEFLGHKKADRARTEPPWLRIEYQLNGRVHADREQPLPTTASWQHWVADVETQLEPFFPQQTRAWDKKTVPFSWHGGPEAQVRVGPMGDLMLLGVEVAGWQGLLLPRQWSDQARHDRGPEKPLDAFLPRVAKALAVWREGLKGLVPAAVMRH